MKNVNLKMIKAGLFTLTGLSSALLVFDASAVCGGSASVTLNKGVLASMQGDSTKRIPAGSVISPVPSNSDTGTGAWSTYGNRYIYLNAFIEERTGATPSPSTWNYSSTVPSNTVPTTNAPGANGDAAGTDYYGPYSLPVVCATSATPNYTSTFKVGNTVSNYSGVTGTGNIGLAGVFKFRSSFQNPTLSLRMGKLRLTKVGTDWELWDDHNGLSFLKLTEVNYVHTAATKTVTLKANLRFADAVDNWANPSSANTTDWGRCYRGTPNSAPCAAPDGGTGTWWITSGLNSTDNALMMGPGTGLTTPTGTGVLTGLVPNAYKTSAGATPTGSEALALVGRISVTYTYN